MRALTGMPLTKGMELKLSGTKVLELLQRERKGSHDESLTDTTLVISDDTIMDNSEQVKRSSNKESDEEDVDSKDDSDIGSDVGDGEDGMVDENDMKMTPYKK